MNFHLFGRHHYKSRISERMENFQNDCCRSWTKKPFKDSYSCKAVKNRKRCGLLSLLIARRSDRLTEVLFFSRVKLRFLRRWWQLWLKPTEIKQRYKCTAFLFVMFRLSVLLLNSMSKLIHNRCTCKLVIIKTLRLQTCMHTETNSCVFFIF